MNKLIRTILKMVICIAILVTSIASTSVATEQSHKAYKYGEVWSSLPHDAKLMFIEGYSEGVIQGIWDGFEVAGKSKKMDTTTFGRAAKMHNPYGNTDENVLINVMTDLYKDPANVYLQYDMILWAAKHKIDGQSIEAELTYNRKLYKNVPK